MSRRRTLSRRSLAKADQPMKSDSSSSTAARGGGAAARGLAQAAERVEDGLDAGHDGHALAGRPGDELLRGGERLVDALHQLAEHVIETLGLLGGERRGPRGLARQRRSGWRSAA